MKPIENWDLIDEAGEFKKLPAGIYLIQFTGVLNVPEKEYLETTCDIAQGDYKGYFKNLVASGLKDRSRFIRSYKQSALSFFKGFITAIEKSNDNFKWDWDENKIIGKKAVGVFAEEEYIDQEGNIKVRTKLHEVRSIPAFKEGKVKIPELKKVTEEELNQWRLEHEFASDPVPGIENDLVPDEELPFN